MSTIIKNQTHYRYRYCMFYLLWYMIPTKCYKWHMEMKLCPVLAFLNDLNDLKRVE